MGVLQGGFLGCYKGRRKGVYHGPSHCNRVSRVCTNMFVLATSKKYACRPYVLYFRVLWVELLATLVSGSSAAAFTLQ